MRLERMTAVARDGNLQTEKAYMELSGDERQLLLPVNDNYNSRFITSPEK